jgi:hypothetical protein
MTTITTTPQGGQTVFAAPGTMVDSVNSGGLGVTFVTGNGGIATITNIAGGPTLVTAASTTGGGINVNVLEGGISQISLTNNKQVGSASVNLLQGGSADSVFNRGGGGMRFDTFNGNNNLGVIGSVTSGGDNTAINLIIPLP